MTSVQLTLPDEIISQIDFGTQSFRDVPGLVIAIDSLDVTASIITLTSLRKQLPKLARAIRSWVTHGPRNAEPTHLIVKGADFEIKLELPPNVQTSRIIEAISKLLDSAPSEADLPGTYRVADRTRVEFADALAAWVPLAYDQLVATAHKYHAYVTYLELSERVQELSGIRTRMLLTNWIGKLLEQVAARAKANGEPPLTSLCVHQDGTIGQGYAQAPKSVVDTPEEDIEYYAARHRLLCYQKYAEDLPARGGEPALTKAESERRARKTTQVPTHRALCTVHFTELPASGQCDYCD